MYKVLNYIIEERKGHYCHCVEVSSVYELECIAESIVNEFEELFTETEILEFLESLTVYSLSDENEDSIYNFSFTDYTLKTL